MTEQEQRAESYARGYHDGYLEGYKDGYDEGPEDGRREMALALVSRMTEKWNEPDKRVFTDSQKS